MKLTNVTLAVFVALVAAMPASAQTNTATGLDSIRWDYEDAQLTTTQVQRFEICFDAQTGSTCTSLTPSVGKFVPTAEQGGTPASGFSAYRFKLPAMTAGDHVVHVAACNVDTCTAASLSFSFVVQPPPQPVGLQFIRGGL